MIREIPNNFNELEAYIIQDASVYNNLLISSDNIYFYDTCSLQCHSNSINRTKIISYIKNHNGIIVITKTILIELSMNNGNIQSSVIEYLREFYDENIPVILFKEENLLSTLRYSSTESISKHNKLLARCIIEVSEYKGTIYDVKNEIKSTILKSLFTSSSQTLYEEFFDFARSCKIEDDNLGEELMFICFAVLSFIPFINTITFLSNDMNSRSSVISINDYTNTYGLKRQPYQLTTATLLYKMHKENILNNKDDMIELFTKSFHGNVPIFYTDEHSIALEKTTMPIEQISNNIFEKEDFRIYY